MTNLPTTIIAGDPGHLGHHNTIHALLNPVDAPFSLGGASSGSWGARPAPGVVGRRYHATGINRVYFDNGIRWVASDEANGINVLDYGAAPGSDCSTAVAAAITAAISLGVFKVVFPPSPVGQWYNVTGDGFLSQDFGGAVKQMIFEGGGSEHSVINFVTTGAGQWLWNNGANNRIQTAVFIDLNIITDSITNGNLFWITSAGFEQAWQFVRCQIGNCNQAFLLDGVGNADEFRFFGGRFAGVHGACYTLSNAQSVGHFFYGTNFEGIYGDVFAVDGGGGGEIYVWGSSIIWDSAVTGTHYIVNITPSGNVGPGNCKFTFHSIKPEFRGSGTQTRLVLANDNGPSGVAEITFYDMNCDTIEGSFRDAWIEIGLDRTVRLVGCRLNSFCGIKISSPASAGSSPANFGAVYLEYCPVPPNYRTLVTLANGTGHVVSRRSQNVRTSGLIGAGDFTPLDFEVGSPELGEAGFWHVFNVTGPTFLNNWTNFDTSVYRAAAYSTYDGKVRLRGFLKNTGPTPGTIIAQLPAEVRPSRRVILNNVVNSGQAGIEIDTLGHITPLSSTAVGFVGLDDMEYELL